jgi:hypothetical protein
LLKTLGRSTSDLETSLLIGFKAPFRSELFSLNPTHLTRSINIFLSHLQTSHQTSAEIKFQHRSHNNRQSRILDFCQLGVQIESEAFDGLSKIIKTHSDVHNPKFVHFSTFANTHMTSRSCINALIGSPSWLLTLDLFAISIRT